MDPYECICEYIWSMRRLIAGLQTQNHCTNTECFSEHPGFETGPSDDGGQLVNLTLVVFIWMIIAVIMFLFRPASLRRSGDHKQRPHSENNDRRSAPPT